MTRLKTASAEFKRHTQLLHEMRKDLDSIFKRINSLKAKTSQQYPQAYSGIFLKYYFMTGTQIFYLYYLTVIEL
jgi:hypothetical protein